MHGPAKESQKSRESTCTKAESEIRLSAGRVVAVCNCFAVHDVVVSFVSCGRRSRAHIPTHTHTHTQTRPDGERRLNESGVRFTLSCVDRRLLRACILALGNREPFPLPLGKPYISLYSSRSFISTTRTFYETRQFSRVALRLSILPILTLSALAARNFHARDGERN